MIEEKTKTGKQRLSVYCMITHSNTFLLVLSCIVFIQISFSQTQLHLLTTLHGDSVGDLFHVVTYIGDVNGDGYDDVLVGAPGGDAVHGNYAKLFLGGATFDTAHALVFHCDQEISQFGFALAGGKDINEDGYPDFVIGASNYYYGGKPNGVADAGKVYVYFGGPKIDTNASFTLTCDQWYYAFGSRLALGDINGDGYADIIVGAPNDDIDAHGRVYIYYGGKALRDTPDVVLEGTAPFDMFGGSIAYVGDVNGDGYGDILIGAPQMLKKPYTGKAYLIYGGKNINLDSSTVFLGDSTVHGTFGSVVAGLGDINDDGFPDFGIMANNYITIISGKDKSTMMRINADSSWWAFQTIAGVGDINNDGMNDFILGIQNRGGGYSGMIAPYLGKTNIDTVPDYTISGTMQKGYFGCSIAGVGHISSGQYNSIVVGQLFFNGDDLDTGKVFIYSTNAPNSINGNITIANKFNLYQNNPNPFNPSTVIRYSLSVTGSVTLKVYDVLGREITTLVNERQSAGSHQVTFDGRKLASGIYFYQLKTQNGIEQKKMLLMK
jgi:hypothetical protein